MLDRYEKASYDAIRKIVREVTADMMTGPDDALSRDTAKNEYQAMLEELLRDDKRLGEFVEFLTDFIRQQSDGWLQSFVEREERKRARMAWVEERIAGNRYFEIADWARSRAERRLAVHVAVDGLQGKLLEGLVRLSSGDRESAGARYVAELVRRELDEAAKAPRRDAKLPTALGKFVVELVEKAPVRREYLENFKKYVFAPDAAAVVVNVATVDTPSISVRNLPIVKSGHGVAGPYGTGIPNFSYLDRQTGRGWYFWGSDVLHLQRIFGNREEEIARGQRRNEGPGARTLFERLWRYNTVSAMATMDGGALEKMGAEVGMAVGELQRNYMEKVLIARIRERARMERELNERRRWLVEHRRLSRSFLGSLLFDSVTLRTFHEYARFVTEHEDEGLPDYLLWYNPWPDHFAHGKGPYSDAIIGDEGEYDRLDFYFGKLVAAYESVPTVDGNANYTARTLFGVTSDHGLLYTPRLVSTDQRLFDAMRAEGIRVTYQKLTHDEGGLPAIHGRDSVKPTRPFDAVVGSTAGGSYVIDLFEGAGLRGDDAAWRRHPDYHALRKHTLLSGQAVDWVERLKRHLRGAMDVALVREYGPRAGERWPAEVESVVRIITAERGEARVYRVRGQRRGGNTEARYRYRYEVMGAQDPLDLENSVQEYLARAGGRPVAEIRAAIRGCISAAEGCEDREWSELLSYTSRLDVVYQYSHLYDSERAGTINIFAAPGVGMNSEVVGRHAGESFAEKNGTQVYFGAGLRRGSIQTARNGSLPVTLYHWFVGDAAFHAVEDGGSPAQQFAYKSLLGERAFAGIR